MLCKRKSFTEATAAIPARARITTGAKSEMTSAVLDTEAEPVAVLGIDETRRGKANYETCPDTGKRVWGHRFDTGLVDITGAGGLLVRVKGRSAAPVIVLGGESPGLCGGS
jgi:hypothetical protein